MPLPEGLRHHLVPLDVPPPPPPTEDAAPRFVLPLDMEPQENDFWCWAAVANAIDRYYALRPNGDGNWKSQCQVASTVFGTNCCGAGASSVCFQTQTMPPALTAVGHQTAWPVQPQLSFDEVAAEVRAGRPVVAFVERPGGHFVVIRGFGTDGVGRWVQVEDSAFPGGSAGEAYYFSTLQSHYPPGGRWTHSYFTTP